MRRRSGGVASTIVQEGDKDMRNTTMMLQLQAVVLAVAGCWLLDVRADRMRMRVVRAG
jgi:hypothetical protein